MNGSMPIKAFNQGYDACCDGKRKSENPHKFFANKKIQFFHRTKELYWTEGWETADYDKRYQE
jgi:ribosome modulation factor